MGEMSSKMSRTHLLLFALLCGLCHSQYDDYGPPPDNSGGESGPGSGDVFGSGDFGSASGSLTTKAPSTTTKKTTATTKAPTTLKPSGKTVVFPKLKSPIANYKFTKVFGVMAFAHKSVAEAKFQHLASILAEWLDNDEDGCVDTPAVLKHSNNKDLPSYVVIKNNGSDDTWYVPFVRRDWVCTAPLESCEAKPECTGLKGTNQCSDTTLEEVLHVLTSQGYALAFPKFFKMGTPSIDLKTKYKNIKSTLASLTDAARGGIPRVPSVPKGGKFPAKAYYTYKAASCQFDCNANEYWWWSTAAMTGLLKNRSEVKDEFKYYLPEVFKAKDPKMYALITDTTKFQGVQISGPSGYLKGKVPTK